MIAEADKDLLAGLRKVGFKLDEENNGGLLVKYAASGGVSYKQIFQRRLNHY